MNPIQVRATAAALVAIAACLVSSLHAQHADLEISVSGGQIVINPRVGEGEFGEGLAPSYRADDPGFDAEMTLSDGEVFGFNVAPITIGDDARNLWFWDGAGAVDFGATAGEHLNIRHLPLSRDMISHGGGVIDSGTGASLVSGFDFAVADMSGSIHDHVTFDLTDATGAAGTIDPPTNGVYLFSLEFTSSINASSDPTYFVLGAGVDEPTLDAGVGFVEANLVPEPSALVLGCVGGLAVLGLWWRTKRRRPAQ